jgi:hypothetical protein
MLNNYSLLNKCIECWKLLTYFGLFEEYSISKEEIRKLLHVTIVTPPPPPQRSVPRLPEGYFTATQVNADNLKLAAVKKTVFTK